MSAADGYVVGLTKIHDAGAPADRFNLVIVAEGFTAAEQALFQTKAQEFADHIFTNPPFDEETVACAINVYRLDVVSDEAGADTPNCGDGSGDGNTVDTYFDATFCKDGMINRLMAGDSALAQTTVESVLPEWTQILVIVNHGTRGGAGGSIAWTTTGGFDWKDVSLHEIGHAAFNFLDEYDCYTCVAGEMGRDNYPSPEPMEPNVTIEPDPTLVKWSALVTAGPDAPTMPNPDCSQRNTGPSPVPAGTVGTFEGAHFYHCGAYRAEYRCKMRNTLDPFCAVCRQVIRDTMATYAAPAVTGAITLDTLSVAFEDIPEDTWTVRPVEFSVDTCLPVTFEVTAPPAAPFSIAYDPLVVSNPDGSPVRVARIWILFQCGSPGTSHMGQTTIRCVETGETWTIPVTGNCVPRPRAAVQLVFDRSGSMLDLTSEGRLKKDVLKDAARVFADVVYEDAGVGANAYDHDPHPLMDIQDAGPVGGGMGRGNLRTAIDDYEPNPAGLTAIGDGIELAKTKLDAAATYTGRAMIVLTDGIETASKRVADVADTVVNETVFAIGLGTAEQIRPATLEALTNGTGGYLLMTGLLTVDDTFLLDKYYLQILAGVSNNDIILDPEGWLSSAAPVRIPFDVTESDIEITGITLATATDPVLMALETPSGDVVGEAQAAADPTMEYARSADSILMRASLPLVVAGRPARAGRWHLLLRRDDRRFRKYLSSLDNFPDRFRTAVTHGIKYSANVHTYSNLRLRVRLDQTSREPGAELMLRTTLTKYGGPFRGSATVSADITFPDGSADTVAMAHQGEGVFTLSTLADTVGIYRFRVRARGTTTRGQPFTREETRTGAVWIGGDQPPDREPAEPGPDLGDFLCCLLRDGVITPELADRLRELGLDVDRLRKCAELLCRPERKPGVFTLDPRLVQDLLNVQAAIRRLVSDAPASGR